MQAIAGCRSGPGPARFRCRAALAGLATVAATGLAGCGGSTPAPDAPASVQQQKPQVWVERGRQALERGDFSRSEQYLKMALDSGVPSEQVVPLLVRAMLSASRLRGALVYAEPYLESHPDEHALRYLVATLRLALGQEQAALRQLDRLTANAPQFAEAQYLRGIIHSPSRPQRAQQAFASYLEIEPQGARAVEVAGRLSDLKLEAMRTEQSARDGQAAPTEETEPTTEGAERDTPRDDDAAPEEQPERDIETAPTEQPAANSASAPVRKETR